MIRRCQVDTMVSLQAFPSPPSRVSHNPFSFPPPFPHQPMAALHTPRRRFSDDTLSNQIGFSWENKERAAMAPLACEISSYCGGTGVAGAFSYLDRGFGVTTNIKGGSVRLGREQVLFPTGVSYFGSSFRHTTFITNACWELSTVGRVLSYAVPIVNLCRCRMFKSNLPMRF